jgi:hypothetical protein
MKPVYRGIALGALQCLLVLSIAGKYAWERERLPRVWAKTVPFDPYIPIRGRYVSLRLEVAFPNPPGPSSYPVTLSAENGVLTAHLGSAARDVTILPGRTGWSLAEPVAYFIPEHAADPTHLNPGEELWVEVSVPPSGPPRPVRLGVKRDGKLTPLDVR